MMGDYGLPDPSGSGMLLPKPFINEKEKTFQYDETLPSLPVPKLQHTLDCYLDSVKPHVTKENYLQTEKLVHEFAQGVGKELQHKLLEKSKHMRNWLEKWWEDYAYLAGREPISPFVNFAGGSPSSLDMLPPEEGSQVPRAALFLWFGLKYWENLRKEQLLVDRGGMAEKKPWSMSQFRRMFNGCRTPGETIDKFNFHFKTEREGECPRHIVVFCRGRIFSMEVVDRQGNIFTAPELEQQLRAVEQCCQAQQEGPKIGAMTGHRRTEWAQARQHLIDLDQQNSVHLHMIETAIMGLTLDDRRPASMSELNHEGLCGDCRNRWFDKTYVLVVFKNGTVACNCDHAPHDAMIMVSATLWGHMCLGLNGGQWQGSMDIRPNLPQPVELVFKTDKKIQTCVEEAIKIQTEAAESIEVFTCQHKSYGRKKIREMKVHPDAHVQVALQYAYYKIYGRPAPTYETASTRQFYNARTETLRSCTPEAVHFAQTMLNLKSTQAEKLEALHAAYDKHNKRMAEGQAAMGCDRHLMGLYLISLESGMETPAIFTDPAFVKSGGGGNYVLSTSFVGYTPVFGGVAPMCKDGYGSFYSIEQDLINFFIASWKRDVCTNAKLLFDMVSSCLDEMMNILTESKRSGGQHQPSSSKL